MCAGEGSGGDEKVWETGKIFVHCFQTAARVDGCGVRHAGTAAQMRSDGCGEGTVVATVLNSILRGEIWYTTLRV